MVVIQEQDRTCGFVDLTGGVLVFFVFFFSRKYKYLLQYFLMQS